MKALHGGLGAAALLAGFGLVAWRPAPPVVEAAAPPAAVQALPLPIAVPAVEARTAPVAAHRAAAAPVANDLDRLIAAARRGDAKASHAAYRALSACAEPGGEPCPGLPLSLLQERLRFLATAVNAGLPAAQIDFFYEGPDRLQALDEQALQAWREQALAGLKAAAARCDPLATGLLATLYDSGELAPRDAARALAYAVAEGELRHRQPSDAALRDRLAEPIDDTALTTARQAGFGLVSACR